jgi:hypothetical protein
MLWVFLGSCMCLGLLPARPCDTARYIDPRYEFAGFTAYRFGQPQRTPRGTMVDQSGHPVDLQYIDAQTAALEACLGVKIVSCAVRVKVAPDWQQDQRGQFFPCTASPDGACTGINQYPALIITTPNLRSYRHELIHLVTHRDHGDPVFAKCDGQ